MSKLGRPRDRDKFEAKRLDYTQDEIPVTIVKRIETFEIVGVRRRVLWRCRELGKNLLQILREHGYDHKKYQSLYSTLRSRNKAMKYETYDFLTHILKMDEVDGWNRPFPDVVKPDERLRVADFYDIFLNDEMEYISIDKEVK